MSGDIKSAIKLVAAWTVVYAAVVYLVTHVAFDVIAWAQGIWVAL